LIGCAGVGHESIPQTSHRPGGGVPAPGRYRERFFILTGSPLMIQRRGDGLPDAATGVT
jgi:hypothetical protein